MDRAIQRLKNRALIINYNRKIVCNENIHRLQFMFTDRIFEKSQTRKCYERQKDF